MSYETSNAKRPDGRLSERLWPLCCKITYIRLQENKARQSSRLGVDGFMSECRAVTNVISNVAATIVVSRWQGLLDQALLRAALFGTNRPAAGRRKT
ncbi:hypothetical protein [Asticcacaulis sp. EMRT-3]|uniref:hypothetical protein n=1 Tax=Asticcacaulis sp. EMRT-3 TaxID=3040349 RepID=UPI0032C21932